VMERARSAADTLLAACILGLATSPVPLLLLGGWSEFSGGLRPLVLLVLLACGFLVFRNAARASEDGRQGLGSRAAETVSWIVVAMFVFVASGINLLIGVERAGVVADSFLLATLVWLPIAIYRRTELERRLTMFAKRVVAGVLLILLATSGLLALVDVATPSRFPGGRKGQQPDSVGLHGPRIRARTAALNRLGGHTSSIIFRRCSGT